MRESRHLRKPLEKGDITYPSQKITRLENTTRVSSYPLRHTYILNDIDRFQEQVPETEITVLKAAKSETGSPIQENISIVKNSDRNGMQANLKSQAIFVHVG